MLSEKKSSGDGSNRVFPVDFRVKGEEFVRVYVDDELVVDNSLYDIINNSVVFIEGQEPPVGSNNVRIIVATTVSEIEDLPTNITNTDIVATDIANINTVATNIVNVNAVGQDIASVNSVALIADDIEAVNTEPLKSSVLNAETNATNAENAWDDFQGRYYGISASDPVTDPLGQAIDAGDLYFNITINRMKVYTGSQWIEAGSAINGMVEYTERLATAGQTIFTSLTYDVGYLTVYRNGVRLPNSDFVATTGTSVTLNNPVDLNDEMLFEAFGAFDSGQLATILSDIDTLQSDLALAEGDIVTLQSDIATANSNIATNTSDIATNTSDIATNTSDISSIDTRVTSIEGDVLLRHGVDTTTPIVTLNVDPTKYDVKAFTYIIDGTEYVYAGGTALSPSFVGAGEFQVLYVDATQTVQKTTNVFLTAGDVNSKLEIGRIATDDGTNITSIGDSAFLVPDFMKNVYARWKFFERTKFGQNAGVITEYAIDQLQIQGGYVSDNNGNVETINSEIELDVFPVYSVGGTTGIRPLVTNMVVPDAQYDNGTDLAIIPNNKFVAHTLFRSMGTGRYYLEYGRVIYNSLIEAQLGITENNLFNQDSSEVEPLARIIVLESQGIQDIRDVRGQPSSQSSEVITALGWKDNIRNFSSANAGGTTPPTWANIGNGIYAFHFTTGDELFVNFHVDHDYALGTPCFPHVHFFCKNSQTVGATVTWRFSYVIAKGHAQGESLTGTPINIDFTYTYDGTEVPGEHIVVECADIDAFDLIEPDTVVMTRVELLNETVTGDIVGLMADLHYQSDRESTPYKEPNFLTGV